MAGGDHLFWRMKPVTGPERELLFCVASASEWERTDIMDAVVNSMVNSGLIESDASGRLVLTRQGKLMLGLVLVEYQSEDIGGGLLAPIVDRTNAHWNIDLIGNRTTFHWNILVPGDWGGVTLPEEGRSISDFFPPRSCVYLLIGLDGAGERASLERICGCDTTGTLYIGCSEDGHRVSQLWRSLRPSRHPYGRLSEGHPAGQRLQSMSILRKRFPSSHLMIMWCYTAEYKRAEALLLDAYETSFGEDPPLNRR